MKSNSNDNFQLAGKMPPNAIELEKAVLGAMMIERDCIDDVMAIIHNENAFYSEANKHIYKAIQELFQEGSAVDILTVTERVRSNGKIDLVGGEYYITMLTMGVVTSANTESHCRVIMEKYVAREIGKVTAQVHTESYEGDAFELIDKIAESATTLTDALIKKQTEHIKGAMSLMLNEIVQKMEAPKDFYGISTGFKTIDKLLTGLQAGDMVVLAARPSVGKTAFALSVMLGAMGINWDECAKYQANSSEAEYLKLITKAPLKSVAFFSLEMSTSQLMYRLVSNLAGIEHKRLKNGHLTDDEFRYLGEVSPFISKLPIYIDDNFGLNMTTLRAKARKLKKKHNIEFLVIDYLQLMKGEKNFNGNREQEISRISRGIKGLAKDLGIPILVLSQLNRSVETRADQRPQLSDLRESGAIEQDADTVMFIFQTDKNEDRFQQIKERGLSVKKNRSGEVGDLVVDFEGAFQRFKGCGEAMEVAVMPAKNNEMENDYDLPF